MKPEEQPEPPIVDEVTRVKLFLGIQAFFLVVSAPASCSFSKKPDFAGSRSARP